MKQLTQSKTNIHHNGILIRQIYQSSCYSQNGLNDRNIRYVFVQIDLHMVAPAQQNSTQREKDT